MSVLGGAIALRTPKEASFEVTKVRELYATKMCVELEDSVLKTFLEARFAEKHKEALTQFLGHLDGKNLLAVLQSLDAEIVFRKTDERQGLIPGNVEALVGKGQEHGGEAIHDSETKRSRGRPRTTPGS